MPSITAPPPVTVRLMEPRDERSGLYSFTTYRILTLCPSGHPAQGLHDVRRRYSDFDFVSSMLTARYAGLVVPPLPPKTFFGRSSAARLRGLTLFAERLARVPTLLLDSLASAFFGLPGADSWETAVRRAEQTRFVYERHSNPGLLRWHALIEKVLAPEDWGLGGRVRQP